MHKHPPLSYSDEYIYFCMAEVEGVLYKEERMEDKDINKIVLFCNAILNAYIVDIIYEKSPDRKTSQTYMNSTRRYIAELRQLFYEEFIKEQQISNKEEDNQALEEK